MVDVARAAHYRGYAGLLEVAGFGAEAYLQGAFAAAERLCQADDLGVSRRVERLAPGHQTPLETGLWRYRVHLRQDLVLHVGLHAAHDVQWIHLRQVADVEIELALAGYRVDRVAALDEAVLDGGVGRLLEAAVEGTPVAVLASQGLEEDDCLGCCLDGVDADVRHAGVRF